MKDLLAEARDALAMYETGTDGVSGGVTLNEVVEALANVVKRYVAGREMKAIFEDRGPTGYGKDVLTVQFVREEVVHDSDEPGPEEIELRPIGVVAAVRAENAPYGFLTGISVCHPTKERWDRERAVQIAADRARTSRDRGRDIQYRFSAEVWDLVRPVVAQVRRRVDRYLSGPNVE